MTNTTTEPQDPRAPEFLEAAADLFKSRNASYGSSYQSTGAALLHMFGGRIPPIVTEEAAQRLYLLIMCLIKLKRYAQNLGDGHKDSADDLMVYAAMLREATHSGDEQHDGS